MLSAYSVRPDLLKTLINGKIKFSTYSFRMTISSSSTKLLLATLDGFCSMKKLGIYGNAFNGATGF